MALSSKYLNNTTKIEKNDFDNSCFKGDAIVYDDDALLTAFGTLKTKIAAVKTAYKDVSKAYDKLLQSTTSGDDMKTNKGIGKGIDNAKQKANTRRVYCENQLQKLEQRITMLETQMAADQKREAEEFEKDSNDNDADEKVDV